jgi:hypothetical protein
MAYEQKPGRGVIFRVREKRGDNSPDFRSPRDCTVIVDGVERQVSFSLWEKHSEKAGDYFSFTVEVKDAVARDDDGEMPDFTR